MLYFSPRKVSALELMNILKPVYSNLGSPRRASEELVLANVMHFAIAAEGTVKHKQVYSINYSIT